MPKRSIIVDTAAAREGPAGQPVRVRGDGGRTHLSVEAFVALHDLKLHPAELTRHCRALARLCRQRNLQAARSDDARWGAVNAYPVELLRQYFKVF